MKINCLLVDDEPLALQLLENYVNRMPGLLELKGTASSASEALTIINQLSNEPLLVFLDIQMPGLSGLELSRMPLGEHVRVVFTTAFSEYALDSYKSQALDYLLKPVSFTEFAAAANKAARWFEMQKKAEKTATATQQERIYVRSEHKLVGIDIDDIIYVEALKDYVMIHTRSRRAPIYTITTMQSMSRILPKDKFMRIHRSYIISLEKITLCEGDTVVLAGGGHLAVSRPYKAALLEYIKARTV